MIMNELLSSNSTRQELMERSRMRAASSAGKSSAELKSRNNEGATDLLSKLRRIMWDHVGVVRTPMGLSHAASLISEIKEEACDLFEETPSMETAGIRDASFAGEAVAEAALNNRVSAGAHCIALKVQKPVIS